MKYEQLKLFLILGKRVYTVNGKYHATMACFLYANQAAFAIVYL